MPDLSGALARSRALAVDLMIDACEIRRGGGEPVTDPDTGDVTSSPGALIYSGPCRVQIAAPAEAQADSGEVRYQLLSVVVSVPVDATVYVQGDVVTVTAAANDPALPGREYRVQSVISKTYATARRLRCEEGV